MGAPTNTDAMGVIDDLMPSEEDLLYEEELLRNPYALKMWWRYIMARMDAPAKRRYLLYERALKALPGSYKVGANQIVASFTIRKMMFATSVDVH